MKKYLYGIGIIFLGMTLQTIFKLVFEIETKTPDWIFNLGFMKITFSGYFTEIIYSVTIPFLIGCLYEINWYEHKEVK